MKDLETTITRCCSCCKRELPLNAFYFNKQQQCPDRYCKACRKTRSQESYRTNEYSRNVNKRSDYLVITQVRDPEIRKELILHALRTVAESIKRKRLKQLDEEILNTSY